MAAGVAWAAPPTDGCGRRDAIGLASVSALVDDGALALTITVTDAPVPSLTVWPLVFVDGLLRSQRAAVELPCRQDVVWSTAPLGAAHAVHWTLLPWPSVPPGLAALSFDEARARYADREPPGLYPWTDVGLLRPAGAAPRPGEVVVRSRPAPTSGLVDDRVELLGPAGAAIDARLVRAPVGRPVAFRLQFAPSELGAGPLVATCLLDAEQIEAFDGSSWRRALALAGELLSIDGVLELSGPGWHRLHCLLLPDDVGVRPDTWPRPLLALYVWGDRRFP